MDEKTNARIISRKQSTTKNIQQPKGLLFRHITIVVESQLEERSTYIEGSHIKIAAARIFMAFRHL